MANTCSFDMHSSDVEIFRNGEIDEVNIKVVGGAKVLLTPTQSRDPIYR